jgi:hypothetical protein
MDHISRKIDRPRGILVLLVGSAWMGIIWPIILLTLMVVVIFTGHRGQLGSVFRFVGILIFASFALTQTLLIWTRLRWKSWIVSAGGTIKTDIRRAPVARTIFGFVVPVFYICISLWLIGVLLPR